MVDVLLRRYVFLSTLNAKLLGFEYVKELYMNDGDFVMCFMMHPSYLIVSPTFN